ncbi:MAG: DUF1624 domain-containing protein [Burkholderiales bacterium]|nr:DUF1624 domain-containing protein [Burkholderiales bacterium]
MKSLRLVRNPAVDALRGLAVLWMTAFHFAFDLNHFGYIRQDFYNAPLWTVQRTCILSLFLLCAGAGQALAVASGQRWSGFWRRWAQVTGCAALVSAASYYMFPNSWIYFGVLHGMAVMLVLCRLAAGWGRWLWPAGAVLIVLGWAGPQAHALWPQLDALNAPALNWLGLVSRKPITEDYVPLLPWLGVMWWGMAAGQLALARGWLRPAQEQSVGAWLGLAFVGRWSLSWYMVHQPLLIGLLTLSRMV